LPTYFTERFNPSLARLITDTPYFLEIQPERLANGIMLVVLASIGVAFMVRPSRDGAAAIRRCLVLMGAFALLTQILYPWYVIWFVPMVALGVQRGRFGLRADAWTGWFLFTGLVMLSYTWFIAMTGSVWTFSGAIWSALRLARRSGSGPCFPTPSSGRAHPDSQRRWRVNILFMRPLTDRVHGHAQGPVGETPMPALASVS